MRQSFFWALYVLHKRFMYRFGEEMYHIFKGFHKYVRDMLRECWQACQTGQFSTGMQFQNVQMS